MLGAMVYEDIRMYHKWGNFVIEYTGIGLDAPFFKTWSVTIPRLSAYSHSFNIFYFDLL